MSEDGWIDWRGGRRPVPTSTLVQIKTRTGVELAAERADAWRWGWTGKDRRDDIIAYRILSQGDTSNG